MQDAIAFGHRDISFIVVGDRKTPTEAGDYCRSLSRRYPYETVFLGVDDQVRFLRDYPELAVHIPWDCIQRRNLGLLLAYEREADVIITIDDDNFLAEPDFIGAHVVVGQDAEIEAFGAPDGWLNVCDFLVEEHGSRFYHRGFPVEARGGEVVTAPPTTRSGRVVVNAGFWLEEPDVDAVTRLSAPVRVTGMKRAGNFALAERTWSPFNSQNTALSRELIPAYFLSPRIGRYDDIWASYVINAIAGHFGHLITFGRPLVRQERNPHDYWRDLDQERDGMRLTDYVTRRLRDLTFTGSTYGECYGEAAESLRSTVNADGTIGSDARAYITGFLDGMDVWARTLMRAGRSRRTWDLQSA
jgi:hypothetical protein